MNSSSRIITLRNDETSSKPIELRAVIQPYSQIKSTDEHRIKEVDLHLLSQLKFHILPKLKNNVDDLQAIRRSGFAFECANAITNDNSHEFCQPFYKQIVKPLLMALNENSPDYHIIGKLDQYFGAEELADTIAMLRTIILCLTESTVDLSILSDFPLTTWRRELLLNALFSNDHSWNLTLAQRIVEKVDITIDSMKEQKRTFKVENILEFLLINQKRHQFRVEFLIDILEFVSREDNDHILKYITNVPIVVRNEENQIVAVTLDLSDLQKIVHDSKVNTIQNYIKNIDGDQRESLQNFLIKYPLDMIGYFVSLIENISNDQIALVIKLLYLLELPKIPSMDVDEFIFGLKSYNAVTWKHKFMSLVIQKLISNEFPSYEELMTLKNHVEERTTNSSRLSNTIQYIKSYWSGGSASSNNSHTTYQNIDSSARTKLQKSPHLHDLLHNLHNTLIYSMSKTNNENWQEQFPVIKILVTNLDSEQKIRSLNTSLKILKDYNVSITESPILHIFWNSSAKNIERSIHNFAIKLTFPRICEKEGTERRKELLQELKDLNADIDITIIGEILDKVDEAENTLVNFSHKCERNEIRGINLISPPVNLEVLDEADETVDAPVDSISVNCPINCLSGHQVKLWAEKYRHGDHSYTKAEILAVMKRAVYLSQGFEIRDIQMISLILMLNGQQDKGRLAQVNTGEGKTLIIAMLAAYFALKGHKVDIITSSSALARPQSQEFRTFYSLFNLTVDHNIDNSGAYNCDIVYGTNLHFQGDILQNEFKKSGGRRNRRFDIAIVDEVDNMLIDGHKNVVLLSAPMPGMEQLQPLLGIISLNVDLFASTLTEKNGELFICDPMIEINDEENDIPADIPIIGTKEDYITKNVEHIMRVHLRDDGRDESLDELYSEIKIPNHLREFVLKVQLKNWIRTAIEAKFGLEERQQYIITNGTVNIVDAQNTGTVQPNTTWSDGLHQFVEIKHHTKMRSESLVSNYLSNVGFFCRYQPRIYGLTGTLGNEHHVKLLEEIYNVDSIIIPPFKSKRHKEFPSIVVNNEQHWYTEIVESTISQISNGRAVLIIMRYIEETEKLAEKFRACNRHIKIKLYRTENDSDVVEELLKSGEVIIATNLAGRGTDIKPSRSMDKNGGIHVCLTYFSENSRVRIQNIGRTSRTGNCGTSQFIILEKNHTSIAELRKIYALEEAATLKKAVLEMRKIKIKDEIFQKFCNLLHSIEAVDGIREKQAIEERFAIWLKIHEHIIEKGFIETYRSEYEVFETVILSNDHKIQNPYLSVLIGNEKSNEGLYSEALDKYTYAINLDPNAVECAYYNRAVVKLAIFSEEQVIDRINDVIEDFNKARQLMEIKRTYLDILLRLSPAGTDLHNQCLRRMKLYSTYISSINIAIGYDKNTLDEKIRQLQDLLDSQDETDDQKKNIRDEMTKLEAKKERSGDIQRILEKYSKVRVETVEPRDYLKDENVADYVEEINELQGCGWINPVKMSERKNIQWSDVFLLTTLGVAQIVVGVICCFSTSGLAAMAGTALIVEGIGDCYKVIRECIMNRNFSWSAYCRTKIITLGISIALSSIKGAQFLLKKAFTKLQSVYVLDFISYLAAALGIGNAHHEVVNQAASYIVKENLESNIVSTIIKHIQPLIKRGIIDHPVIQKMLTIDLIRNNDDWKSQILRHAFDVLTSMRNVDFRQLKIALFSDCNEDTDLGTIAKSTKKTSLMDEICKVTEKFLVKFFVSIDEDEYQVNRIMSSLEPFTEILPDEGSIKLVVDQITKAVAQKIRSILQMKSVGLAFEGIDVENYDINDNSYPKRIISRRNRIYKKKVQPNENSSETTIEDDDSDYSSDSENREVCQNIEKVNRLIEDITSNNPMNIKSLGVISDLLKRPIIVWDEEQRFKYKIGEPSKRTPIDVQFLESYDQSVQYFRDLKSNNENTENPKTLLEFIAEQCQVEEYELKASILDYLQNNIEEVSCKINDVARLEMYDKIQSFHKIIRRYEDRFADVNLIVDCQRSLEHFCEKASIDLCNYKPFNNDIVNRLNTTASNIKKTIEIYDSKNNLHYIVCKDIYPGSVLKLKYHAERFSQINEDPSLNLSSDMKSLNKFAKAGAYTYAASASKMAIGFISDYQEKRIVINALSASHEILKEFIQNTDKISSTEVMISNEELELLDKESYMAFWKEGKMKCTWPLNGVILKLKANSKDNCDSVDVHVQIYTIPPHF